MITLSETDFNTIVEALIESKTVIRGWHGMGAEPIAEQKIWTIYETHSPEMKRINAAINVAADVKKNNHK